MSKVKSNLKTHRRTYIRAWRKYRGLSQERLAERVGVTKGALSQLENGIISYTQPMLEALADAMQCEPQDLIMRDPSDPEGIWSLYESLSPSEQNQAITILKALKRAS